MAFAVLPFRAVPETGEFLDGAVVAHAEGRVLWRVPIPVPDGAPRNAGWRPAVTSPVQVVARDGEPDVLALLSLVGAEGRFVQTELFCFSARGEVRWRYAPEERLVFGDRTYDGPWPIEQWVVTAGSTAWRVWLSARHEPWWPAYLVSIDPAGRSTVRFVHPGHLYVLADVSSDSVSYVVAAGINNEYASAMLAVLDQNGPPAAAPSEDPRFTCRGCPSVPPSRYLLFPRTELNHLTDQPYNRAYAIDVSATGLEVSVQEATMPHMRAIYRLSPSFVPLSVGFSDAYWEAHRKFEKEGRLDHPAADCPVRREGMKVRIWDDEQGWTERVVPVTGG